MRLLEYVGFLGVLAILLAWIPQTAATIRSGECDLNVKFAILYCIGSFLLTVHAFLLKDLPFLTLNGIATIIALVNLDYALFPRKAFKLMKRRGGR